MLDTADAAWYEDVRALWRRPTEFFPAPDHTDNERLNALVRLVVYVSVATALLSGRTEHVLAGGAVAAALSLAHRHGTAQNGGWNGGWNSMGSRNYFRNSPQRGDGPKCTASSATNPFANRLIGDAPDKPSACKYDAHAAEVEQHFNAGLVRDVYDVYDKQNGRRQFMTMPVTGLVPDTLAFARFCYGSAGRRTCKEDSSKCTGV